MRFYIDCETTGLNPTLHEIIEVAIIIEDKGKVVAEFCKKIQPMNIAVAEQKAIDVNGYTLEKWKDAEVPSAALADYICKMLSYPEKEYYERGLWIGHNPHFDRRFIQAFIIKYATKGVKLAPMPLLDTKQIALALYWPGLSSFSLDSIRGHLGLGSLTSHEARNDAYMCKIIMDKFFSKMK